MNDLSDRELLDALGIASQPTKPVRTAQEECVIAGFEDILRFVETHGRPPRHGEGRDIFERLYAVRLDRLRASQPWRDLLSPLDPLGLLAPETVAQPLSLADDLDDAALMSELGLARAAPADVTLLRHVSSRAEIRAAEEIANRTPCGDFDSFKPLFTQAEADLKAGRRQARSFGRDASIATGDFFILGGQTVYVAETKNAIRAPNGERDARLRVIYSNGTESNLLRRSLQRALYKDDAGRRLTELSAGPLFGGEPDDGDLESGTIYVLRSRSEHPLVAAHRELIHKIGVTGGRVETRIANAALDPTYLLADVDIVGTARLFNVNRAKLEAMFHRLFANARLDLTIEDRFGQPVKPREWFLVPLHVINEAVDRVRDETITRYEYDTKSATLRQTEATTEAD